MTTKKIALIGYPAEYFLPFAESLEQASFEVYWVCAQRADAKYLLLQGVAAHKVLDVNATFSAGRVPPAQCRDVLAQFENDVDPKVNDIILMDRILSKKDTQFSVAFLHHVATEMARFFQASGIELISSWRDTAVQLVSLLVAKKLGISFVVPTRIRIPQEYYGFCSAHHTDSFIGLRDVSQDDVDWAVDFLNTFENRPVNPGLKTASRSFLDVVRMLPAHISVFLYELRRSFADIGNSHTRYSIATLMAMYAHRRVNLLLYRIFRPAAKAVSVDRPFSIYALHTQPESSIDVQGAFFSNQIELIKHIARSLPSDHQLFVKVHPTDVDGKSIGFYRQIRAIPGVVLVDYSVNTRSLLNHASIVFTVTGTMGYEAALLQKPVIVFARNFFNRLPTVHRCDAPPALASMIHQILAGRGDRENQREVIISFLAELKVACFEGEVSRSWVAKDVPLKDADLLQLQSAYTLLYDDIATTRSGHGGA